MDFRIEKKESFQIMGLSGYTVEGTTEEDSLWGQFIYKDNGDGRTFNEILMQGFYSEPFHQVGAYDFESIDGKTPTIIGAEYKGKKPNLENLSFKTIPAATWAVFSITGLETCDAAWARVITEWLPQSGYIRNEAVPNLDVYPGGTMDENYIWEIWLPIIGS